MIDALSVFPFEAVGAEGLDGIRVIRCLRMIKLLRIARCSRVLWKLQQRITLSFALQDLIKFVTLTIFGCHWMACIFGLASGVNVDPDGGWFPTLVGPAQAAAAGPATKYLHAFYWAIATV